MSKLLAMNKKKKKKVVIGILVIGVLVKPVRSVESGVSSDFKLKVFWCITQRLENYLLQIYQYANTLITKYFFAYFAALRETLKLELEK